MALFGGSDDDVLPYVEELVAAAEGPTVTAESLTGTRLNDPVLTYLDDGEQPHHVLVATDSPLRANERGSVTTVDPGSDFTAVTVLTDERVVFVVGSPSGDEVRSVEHGDVYEFEVDAGFRRTRLEVTVRDARYTAYFSRFVDAGAVEDFLERATDGILDHGATPDISEADSAEVDAPGSLSPDEVERALRTLDGRDFERFVADLWRVGGWTATVTRGSADRGIDVVATRDEPVPQKHVLQAKRYAVDNPVGSPEIQQYASLHRQEEGVDAVVVVTTGGFTRQAERVAEDLNVKLIDGEDLARQIVDQDCHGLLVAHGASVPDGLESRRASDDARQEPAADAARTDGSSPVAPRNGSPAVGADDERSHGHRSEDPDSEARSDDDTPADASATNGSTADTGDEADGLSVADQSVIRSTGTSRGTYGSVLGHVVVAVLTAWWTLGVGNLAYASWAHHHETYPRPDQSDEALDAGPARNWYYGIPVGLALVVCSALAGWAGFRSVAAAGLLVGWILLPVATLLDVRSVRARTDWNPITGWWLIGVVVPPLAVVVVPLYALKRYLASRSPGHGMADAEGKSG